MMKKMVSFIGLLIILGLSNVTIGSYAANADSQTRYGTIVVGHSQKCLAVSTDGNSGIVQQQCDNTAAPYQKFVLVQVGASSSYKIKSKYGGKCLGVPDGPSNDNLRIQYYPCIVNAGRDEWGQNFQLNPVGNGYYNIKVNGGKCLNVQNGSNDDNASLTQLECNNKSSQMFWFSGVSAQSIRNQY